MVDEADVGAPDGAREPRVAVVRGAGPEQARDVLEAEGHVDEVLDAVPLGPVPGPLVEAVAVHRHAARVQLRHAPPPRDHDEVRPDRRRAPPHQAARDVARAVRDGVGRLVAGVVGVQLEQAARGGRGQRVAAPGRDRVEDVLVRVQRARDGEALVRVGAQQQRHLHVPARPHLLARVPRQEVAVDEGVPHDAGVRREERGPVDGPQAGELVGRAPAADGAGQVLQRA